MPAAPRRPPRPGTHYPPDLRPMLILGVLLVGVVVGWVLISPLVLPPADAPAAPTRSPTGPMTSPRAADAAPPDWRSDDDEPYPFTTPVPALVPTAVDGTWTREATDPYRGDRAPCRRCPPYPLDRGNSVLVLDRGRYEMLHVAPAYRALGHYVVDGDELVVFNDAECPHERGRYRWHAARGSLELTVIDDPCAFGQRSLDFTARTWSAAADDRCEPPNPEAAITGHWPAPPGCDS